ncbi:MAG TPA: HAMP domain-containing sensor histidine kinase [Terriglobales bacterium]|nr:HAMP domain-containing sensor histidine kinase [Terriglobales bacterium]
MPVGSDSEVIAACRRLIASTAHELKNPLEAIKNIAFLLGKSDHLDATEREYIDLLKQEVERLTSITDSTLHLNRSSEVYEPVSIAGVLGVVLDFYAGKIKFKQIQVDVQLRQCAPIAGISVQLRQVFTNLVVNALEALPVGGRLTIRMRDAREWGNSHACGLMVSIFDNGSGIELQDQRKLFSSFFTTKGARGSGLGLWLSNDIIQRYGGTIRFRSSTGGPHHGTCFQVFLPRRAPGAELPS